MELELKKCIKCNALIRVLKNCECDNCDIMCCNEQMKNIIPNSTEASFEKHLPNYEIKGDKIRITVNHVMENNHYIEWILYLNDDEEHIKFFKPGETATIEFTTNKKGTLYSYCNTHGLWKTDIK